MLTVYITLTDIIVFLMVHELRNLECLHSAKFKNSPVDAGDKGS